MLYICVLDFGGSWDQHLPLCEFVYNNCYDSSIGTTLFEALYGRFFRAPTSWTEVGNKCHPIVEYDKRIVDKVVVI